MGCEQRAGMLAKSEEELLASLLSRLWDHLGEGVCGPSWSSLRDRTRASLGSCSGTLGHVRSVTWHDFMVPVA